VKPEEKTEKIEEREGEQKKSIRAQSLRRHIHTLDKHKDHACQDTSNIITEGGVRPQYEASSITQGRQRLPTTGACISSANLFILSVYPNLHICLNFNFDP
jgi:hypothetical protein